MTSDIPARRRGASTLLGTSEADAMCVKRVFVNRVNEIESGPGMGKVVFTRDAGGRITAFSVEFDRPDGTVTATWTFTKRGDGLASELSEGVVT